MNEWGHKLARVAEMTLILETALENLVTCCNNNEVLCND